MRLTLLGTGDAGGMPRYGCQCARCMLIRQQPELRRRSTCALLEWHDQRYLIDAGIMDIAERFPAPSLSGVLLTHFHADHVQGLFHLRWGCDTRIRVFCPPDSHGCDDLFKHPGILDFSPLKKFVPVQLDGLTITPLPMIHSKPTFGYLFEHNKKRIAYLTDTRDLPPAVTERLTRQSLDAMIIDTTTPPQVENRNHNNLDDTLRLHDQIQPGRTLLTHIGHDMDVWLSNVEHPLPDNVLAGYDGLTLE